MQVHIIASTEDPIIIDDHVDKALHHGNTLQSELNQEPQQSEEQDDFFEIQQCPKKSKPKGQKLSEHEAVHWVTA